MFLVFDGLFESQESMCDVLLGMQRFILGGRIKPPLCLLNQTEDLLAALFSQYMFHKNVLLFAL